MCSFLEVLLYHWFLLIFELSFIRDAGEFNYLLIYANLFIGFYVCTKNSSWYDTNQTISIQIIQCRTCYSFSIVILFSITWLWFALFLWFIVFGILILVRVLVCSYIIKISRILMTQMHHSLALPTVKNWSCCKGLLWALVFKL